jgi:hypothetical protein
MTKFLFGICTILSVFLFVPQSAWSQNTEKIIFNSGDSSNDYYLAIQPLSGNVKGVMVMLTSFMSPESVLSESKLQNVAYGNDLLTIVASLEQSLSADSSSVSRISNILKNVINHFSPDTSGFAIGALGYTGNTILRYTEMCYENPKLFPVLPKAVFAINCPVDLSGLIHWCEEEIKKNYYQGNVGDARFILNALSKTYGTYQDHPEKYIQVSPFYRDASSTGNEKFLAKVPVRLYYDTDVAWELKTHRNSYYDTYIPDGSELIKRLLLEGNEEAEFIPSKQPGMRSNGIRTSYSWSLPDEIECIQWIKLKLKIFNPQTYSPVYNLPVPAGWSREVFALPPDFAKQIKFKGVEELRFFPGWGDEKTEDYWSYAFLWWLEGNQDIDAPILQDNLKILYSGLIERNIVQRRIPKEKLFPVEVKIHNIKTAAGDLKTFEGTVHMLDYIQQAPMILNLRIHIRDCTDKSHTSIFLEISPKSFDHPNWQQLDKLYLGFECIVSPKPKA